MTADVEEVARRVVGLLDHPRRRLSVLRRFVWPFRILGAVARLCPPLGDRMVRLMQRESHERTPSHVKLDESDGGMVQTFRQRRVRGRFPAGSVAFHELPGQCADLDESGGMKGRPQCAAAILAALNAGRSCEIV